MVTVKVYCFDCKGRWELYPAEMKEGSPPAICPHCGRQMPQKPFDKLLNVTMMAEEVEKDLRNAAFDRGEPLFSVDWMNFHPRTIRREPVKVIPNPD